MSPIRGVNDHPPPIADPTAPSQSDPVETLLPGIETLIPPGNETEGDINFWLGRDPRDVIKGIEIGNIFGF